MVADFAVADSDFGAEPPRPGSIARGVLPELGLVPLLPTMQEKMVLEWISYRERYHQTYPWGGSGREARLPVGQGRARHLNRKFDRARAARGGGHLSQ